MEIPTIDQSTWIVRSLLHWSAEELSSKAFENARLNAELLLSHVLQCKRIDLYLNFAKPLTADQLAEFKSFFKRRLTHEPLQYILGETEFMGLRFTVDRRVLIPRPDTEVLVEQVIDHVRKSSSSTVNILDIGTGSGNIAVSLAYHLEHAAIDAIDSSGEALELAKENAKQNAMEQRITFNHVDLLKEQLPFPHQNFDVIVSNPPYISSEEFVHLQPEVKDYEPLAATTDSADGLTFYKKIADVGKLFLRNGGAVIVEMAYNQSPHVSKIFSNYGYSHIEISKDYSGIERVLKARWL
jgi:release factor glutamine methyltransferase